MSAQSSLARGALLDAATWADFVERLHHDCVGEGVARHYTADAIFIVQAKKYTYGLDTDYGAELVICHEDSVYLTAKDFYENFLDDDERNSFDAQAKKEHEQNFLQLDEYDQRCMMEDVDGVTVTGRAERWEYASAHLTRDAADAFIKRKGHDYRDGLRIYVEAQTYSWEYNTIKEAILSGRLMLAEGGAA